MSVLRPLLLCIFALIAIYTVLAVSADGWNLIAIFFGDIVALGWRGQFNLDFATYLLLSALWVMWRHGFSGGGIALGLAASVLGMLFFAPYLLWASGQSGGDIRRLLLGVNAA